MTDGIEERKRWLALIVLCLGVLMIVLDTTIVNGALGLAILASLAAAHTDGLAAAGADAVTALNSGYHLAFLLGAIAAAMASALAGAFVRASYPSRESRAEGQRLRTASHVS